MKPSLPRRSLAGLGVLLLWLPAFAATPPAPSLPPMLASLAAGGKLKVVSQFSTEVPGLTGYVVSNKDGTQVVYGENGYLFVGHVISPKGADLTDAYRDRYGPKADFGSVVSKLDGAGHLINEGRAAAPLLYVFADPNCSFCYHFYKMAEPLVSSGRLRLRWVMVAFLQSSSAAKATAILSARNPLSALHEDEDRFDTVHEAGGIAPASAQEKALQAVLQVHASAMDAVGSNGTPTLLYRDEQGRWATVVGLPTSDWLTQYAAGKHLPADPNG
ncbi:MAG TPA: thiol:disulfide interchange protein DsbG [Steroidobacteraceae bacterium]|jgi:thiol:disulfide interchange protein DsbG|nr:thiol:disulfide interchange protein DsbG [Steroidobacteraceae bacterium]